MTAIRRVSLVALGVACLHLVFGAIVRISGSGMGCGNNWPKCEGYWIPPFSRPDLIIEVSHRYLASILVASVSLLCLVAWRARRSVGVSGAGGPLRTAFAALGAVVCAAVLGGVTVKLGNAPFATVAHWIVAMTLLALVAATAVRAGAFGGRNMSSGTGSRLHAQLLAGAAAIAMLLVTLGGVTAKYPNAGVGCLSFPLCGANPEAPAAAVAVQLAHRATALLFAFYMVAVIAWTAPRRDREDRGALMAARMVVALVAIQILIAGAMIGLKLPPFLRSAHEAVGVAIWLTTFIAAYLAHRAARAEPESSAATSLSAAASHA